MTDSKIIITTSVQSKLLVAVTRLGDDTARLGDDTARLGDDTTWNCLNRRFETTSVMTDNKNNNNNHINIRHINIEADIHRSFGTPSCFEGCMNRNALESFEVADFCASKYWMCRRRKWKSLHLNVEQPGLDTPPSGSSRMGFLHRPRARWWQCWILRLAVAGAKCVVTAG